MAIPQGRLSTTLVKDALLEPEGNQRFPLVSHERGPIAIEDTSAGLLYQNWIMTYVPGTGEFIATPQTVGGPSCELIVADVNFLSFTFDQNGRIVIAYTTNVSSFLYWYDTELGSTTTKDLGSAVSTPFIYLDDKRKTQSAANDMLLWYTRPDVNGAYWLFMLRQRDRFEAEYMVAADVKGNRIQKLGMHAGLRIQIHMGN